MADEHTADYDDHLQTYEGFLAFFTYGAAIVAVILILMAFFLL